MHVRKKVTPSRPISDIYKFQNFFVKNEKENDNYGLNYHRYTVQPLVLHILWRSFQKCQC